MSTGLYIVSKSESFESHFAECFNAVLNPRAGLRGLRFKGVDQRGFFHGQANVIKTFEQAVLFEAIDFKGKGGAVSDGHGLLFEVDCDAGVLAFLGLLHDHIDLLLGQRDGQDAVFEAVVVEDVSKAGRDYGADTEIKQCPRGVFALRASAKVITSDDDLGVAIRGLVQH